MHNLYVLSVDMEKRSVEEIAWGVAVPIVELFDDLVENSRKRKIK